MRDPIENISHLQAQLNDLQLENQILKNILDGAGISYTGEIMRLRATEELCDCDTNQGARIQFPSEITEKNGSYVLFQILGKTGCICKKK